MKDGDKNKLEDIVNQFSIERLTKNSMNKEKIKSFHNSRNPNLQEYLRKYAWQSDKNHETVTYLIQFEKKIVCYFTLKCGMLLKNGNKRNGGKVEPTYENNKIFVNSTISAIEISQFCMNEKWIKQNPIAKGCGQIIFYRYIIPIISRMGEYIGCKYIYLYAADETEDETLIKYYERLGLKKISEIEYCTIFPKYDMSCALMFNYLNSYKNIDYSVLSELNELEENKFL